MKFILLLLVVVVVLWVARGGLRRGGRRETPAPANELETIVACRQCGLHLPRGEALPGRGGDFCCEAHRAAFEQAQR